MKSFLINLTSQVGDRLELARRRKKWSLIDKGEEGIATTADIEAEKFIIHELQKHYPGIGIWSEEGQGDTTQESIAKETHYWLVDPLDGTNNFANGLGIYCISIALCQGVDTDFAFIYNPVEKTYFYARKGRGAYFFDGLHERKLKTTWTKTFRESLFSPGRLRKKRLAMKAEKDFLDQYALDCRAIRRLGSAAWEIALCSAGILDGFWLYGLKPWDIAAGILIAREAGLIVNDFNHKKANVLSGSLYVLPKQLVKTA